MAWPLSQDYNEAIQNPAQSFADPELRQGEAETNELGLPAPRSGNFADVYAVVTGQRKWAVKCFTRQIPGLQERYQQISLHLKEHRPSFMVDFTFLEKGIRVRGDWYPILKMEWVEGTTLNQFVKTNLHKPQVFDMLCQLWVKLSSRLRKANIAHCDLQHGNVLLVPASRARALAIKLVDYDGMCVPSLTLLKSIEVGHPSYQHRQRQREGIYNLEVDRFSHLVIYTALRGLEVGGKALWEKYDDGDNLLFKPADFAAPSKSRLLYELLKSEKPEVARMARVLAQAAKDSMDKAPLLEELVPEALAPPTSVTAGASAAPAPADEEENVFASQLEGSSAVRRPRTGPKKSLTIPVIGAGILGAILLVVAGFFLFGGSSPTPPADDRPKSKLADATGSRPKTTELIYPAPGDKKTNGNEDKSESARKPPVTSAATTTTKTTGPAPPTAPTRPSTSTQVMPTSKGNSGQDGAAAQTTRGKPEVDKTAQDRSNPPPPGQVELNIVARIDGIDDILISRERAVWKHYTAGTPDVVKMNGIAWKVRPVLPNSGKTQYLPPGVDLTSATLEKKRGRGEVKLIVQQKDLLVVQFNDPPSGADVYEAMIQFSPSLHLTVIATIDGMDDLIISPRQLEWAHRDWDMPKDVTINGMAWPLDQDAILSNTGSTRYLPDGVDLSTAKLTVKQGRESISLLSQDKDLLVVRFDDHTTEGEGLYDIVLTMDRKKDAAGSPAVAKRESSKGDSPKGDSPKGDSPRGRAPFPVPSEAEQDTALNQIKDMYKDDFNARKARDLEDLATRLFQQGQKTKDDPALQYVLLREACTKAAKAPNVELAMQAIDEMAKHFTVNILEQKEAALNVAGRESVTTESIKTLVSRTIDVAKEAASDDRYEVAERLLGLADKAVSRSPSKALKDPLRACSQEVHALHKEYDRTKAEIEKLTINPNDPDASLAVGRFYCFAKKQWAKGLPYLARGSDRQLAELATLELQETDSPEVWLKLGDAWRTFAAKADLATRTVARNKAGDWYVKAYPRVNDAEAARVEKVLSPWAKDNPRLRPAVYALDTSQAIEKKGFFLLEPGKTMSTRRQYSGPLVITVDVRTGQHSLMLRAYEGALVQFREIGTLGQLHLLWPDSDPTKRLSSIRNFDSRTAPLVPGARQVIRWQVTSSGMAVVLSGKVPFTISGDLDLSRRGPVVIASQDAPVEVYDLRVAPLR
jgi:hypothetical protein